MAKPVILRFVGDTTSLEAAFRRAAGGAAVTQGAMSKASAAMVVAGQKMKTAGSVLNRNVTLPVIAAGVASVKLAVDFESSMGKIRGLVGVSSKQVKAWSEQILDMSRTLPQSPKELADALYFVTSSGIETGKAMGVVKASARAAAAGLGQTEIVADAVTSAINAYGFSNLSAAKATDILTATVREGKGEPEDLAASIGRVIAPAQTLGVSFDQVGAAMASMTLVGLDASESATALRGVLMALQKPTKQQTDQLKEMGLNLGDVRKTIREKGLLAGLDLLRKGSINNAEAAAKLFGNVRALNGFLIMTGKNAGNTRRIFGELANSTGATDKAFKAASKTGEFKLKKALAGIQAAAIRVGNVLLPVVEDVAAFVADLANEFGKLNPSVQKWILIAAGAAAVMGPLLVMLGAVVTAVGAIGIPAMLVIAALAGLAAAGVLLYQKWKPFREFIDTFVKRVRAFATGIGKAFKSGGIAGAVDYVDSAFGTDGKIASSLEGLGEVFDRVFGDVGDVIDDLGTLIQPAVEYVSALVMRISQIVGVYVGIITNLWNRFGSHLVDHIRIAWNYIVDIVRAAIQIVRGIIQVATAILTGDWGKAWKGIKDVFAGVWKIIVATLKSAVNLLSTIIGAAMALVSAVWGYAWRGMQALLGGVWNGIVGIVRGAVGSINGAVMGIVSFIAGVPGAVLGHAVRIGQAIVNGIAAGLGFVGNLASGVINAVKGGINWVIDRINQAIPDSIGWGPISLDLPDNPIPRLAAGDVVSKPTLAVIGEAGPEAVIPLTRPQRAAQLMDETGLSAMARTRQGGASGGIHIDHVSINALNPREAVRAFSTELAWASKTGGF